MRTHCTVTKRVEHPLDLLQELEGRMATLGRMAGYSLMLREYGSPACEIPDDVARGIESVVSDFRDLKGAVAEWFEQQAGSCLPER